MKVMLQSLNEDEIRDILSGFECPFNPDIEYFLKQKSIEFAKQGIAQTHLVLASYKDKPVIAGYYSLAQKSIIIDSGAALSSNWKRRINKFALYDRDLKAYVLSVPLIAQLGKNYSNGFNKLISGNELLKMACDKVQEIQMAIGGRMVYLECEDIDKLKTFYHQNGFYEFARRELDREEHGRLSGRYLIQMIKYLN